MIWYGMVWYGVVWCSGGGGGKHHDKFYQGSRYDSNPVQKMMKKKKERKVNLHSLVLPRCSLPNPSHACAWLGTTNVTPSSASTAVMARRHSALNRAVFDSRRNWWQAPYTTSPVTTRCRSGTCSTVVLKVSLWPTSRARRAWPSSSNLWDAGRVCTWSRYVCGGIWSPGKYACQKELKEDGLICWRMWRRVCGVVMAIRPGKRAWRVGMPKKWSPWPWVMYTWVSFLPGMVCLGFGC